MKSEHRRSFWALITTQFFGAFNDNLLKFLVQTLVLAWVLDSKVSSQLVVLGTVIFDAPFIIFSMIAGRVSDRYPKPTVIRWVQIWQFFVVTVAFVSVYFKSVTAMMVSIFFLSMQATFFSPSKYGLLPELLSEEELPDANGILNMLTFVAILTGVMVATLLAHRPLLAAGLLVLGAVGGLIGSLFIAPLPAANPQQAFAFNPFSDFFRNWRVIGQDRGLKLGIIAVNYFWFVAAIFLTVVLVYAKEMMPQVAAASSYLAASTIIGIAVGSVIAGKLSKGRFDQRIVEAGALGMSLACIDLYWAWNSLPHAVIGYFLVGATAGCYEVPLMALVQARCPADQRGKLLATQNFLSFVAIFIGAAALWVLQTPIGLNPAQIFLVLGLASLGGTVFATLKLR